MKIALVDDERIYLDEMQKLCLEFAAQHTIQPEIFRFSSSEDFLKSWQHLLLDTLPAAAIPAKEIFSG